MMGDTLEGNAVLWTEVEMIKINELWYWLCIVCTYQCWSNEGPFVTIAMKTTITMLKDAGLHC